MLKFIIGILFFLNLTKINLKMKTILANYAQALLRIV